MQVKTKAVSRKVIKLEPGKTLGDARNAMQRYNISRIVVDAGNKLAGMVTRTNIVEALASVNA